MPSTEPSSRRAIVSLCRFFCCNKCRRTLTMQHIKPCTISYCCGIIMGIPYITYLRDIVATRREQLLKERIQVRNLCACTCTAIVAGGCAPGASGGLRWLRCTRSYGCSVPAMRVAATCCGMCLRVVCTVLACRYWSKRVPVVQ
jgi:hypothetical protein